jgi:hypothetical protein
MSLDSAAAISLTAENVNAITQLIPEGCPTRMR